jgi:VIT1/CCC1 family predicted Fe2+/Mn2+ transporter
MALRAAFDSLRDYLKQIVFGGNDGIITTFAIVAGFAGAQAHGTGAVGAVAVLIFGLANLAADATSMGLGEFLSGRSNRDLYAARHRDAMVAAREDPDTIAKNMARHLISQGLEPDIARHTADHLATAPNLMADLTLRYEHGMEAPEASNLTMRSLMTFASFVVFGFIPILPFVLLPGGENTFWISVLATGVALALLGLLRFAVTGDRLLRAVGETVSLGALCAAIAYGTGLLVAGLG